MQSSESALFQASFSFTDPQQVSLPCFQTKPPHKSSMIKQEHRETAELKSFRTLLILAVVKKQVSTSMEFHHLLVA